MKVKALSAYGDDWIIFLGKHICDNVAFARNALVKVGIELKDMVSGFMDNGAFESNIITFLKTGIYNGLPGRLLKEVVKRLRFSHKYARYGMRSRYEILVSMFLYSWGNYNCAKHIIEYINFMYDNNHLLRDEYVSDMIRIAMRIWNNDYG